VKVEVLDIDPVSVPNVDEEEVDDDDEVLSEE
jgi:hypothetical protein